MDQTPHQVLSTLLAESDAYLTADQVLEIIPGVVAAPGDDGGNGGENSWMDMAALNLSPRLIRHLDSLLNTARKSEINGLVSPCPCEARITLLRKELLNQNLDGFVVPVADEHQGEYLPKCAQRLRWLTGFTGSAGVALILKNKAALFVDGRYTLQAANEVDENVLEIFNISDMSPDTWISSKIGLGDTLGYDPWLHTVNGALRLKKATEKSGANLLAIEPNAIDIIWNNQPAKPLSPIKALGIQFTGQSSSDKRSAIAKNLNKDDLDAVIITSPASIAWLGNLRGGDVPYTPFTLSFGILHADARLDLFVDPRKVSPSVAELLKDDVSIQTISEFTSALDDLGGKEAKILIDPATTAEAIHLKLEAVGAKLKADDDPCILPKSCKNDVELEGIRAAHRRDGLALTRFLGWLSMKGSGKGETEISAAERLETFRREGEHIQGLSFPTISGAGPNGAIIHYRVTEKSNQPLKNNGLYLVDSGAQYLDGTTDVTRTIAIGTPTDEMRDRFTRVLSGHIALATVVFPEGTTGSQLDALARAPLWKAGLDYDHGTGHGVGHYLGVHEGPHRISKSPSRVSLKPGMIVSNEPGYYKHGAYGIRIENLLVVINIDNQVRTNKKMLGFETLTVAPIDLSLVERALLSSDEAAWLNSYHSRVFDTHNRNLDHINHEWLKHATREI